MNLPKTIRQIYRDETGKDAEMASPLEGFELAVYVEAPSKDYIDWLERRASRTGGSANTSTNTHIAQALREIAADMEAACGGCPADLVADVHYKARIKGWARQLRNVS